MCHFVKYRLFMSYFNETCILATYFGDNNQILNFMETHSVGAELFWTRRDGQTDRRTEERPDSRTDMTKLI
jgi:hypothetical protein